ncbi:conserved hypothetical protein (large hypothetical surface-anchored protein) [Alteracholeplasma palmae J233]|uniref:Cadherin-like beta-sandwich-like domain-containing protein n=2 Tax=Acholeplasma palmae TaxID=38986 RepID=U4KKS1_ALTPJ|nr:conserved hypothetical protein (large hypothetical surface-anchored protein) [Alteracholeplasma palmae J233]
MDLLAISAEEEDFGEIIDLGYDYILMDVWVEAIDDGVYYLDEYSSQIEFNDVIKGLDGDESSENGWGKASSPRGKGNVIGYASDGQKGIATKKNYPAKVGTVRIEYDKNQKTNDFSITLQYYKKVSYYTNSKKNGELLFLEEKDLKMESFIIGDPNSGPDASLETLSVEGTNSKTKYLDKTKDVPEANEITITYQDSLQPLIINATAKKGAATKVTVPAQTGAYTDGQIITITSVYTDPNDNTKTDTKTYTIKVNVTEAATNNKLDEVIVTGKNKGKDFSSKAIWDETKKAYYLEVEYGVESVIINTKPISNLATIDKTTETLNNIPNGGESTTTFTVTSESNEKATYNVIISRKKGSNITDIKELTINGSNALNKIGDTYEVSEQTDLITIVAKGDGKEQKIEYSIDGTNWTSSLTGDKIDYGQSNQYYIRVTAEDGTTADKTITVKRAESSDSSLKLYLDEGSAPTTADKYLISISDVYYLKDSNKNPFLKMIIDSKATIELNGTLLTKNGNEYDYNPTDLKLGENVYTITVIAQNGTSKEYIFTIYKSSSDAGLKDIRLTDKTGAKLIKGKDDFTITGRDATVEIEYSDADKNNNNVRIYLKAAEKSTITIISGGGFTSTNTERKDKTGNLYADEGYILITFTDLTIDEPKTIHYSIKPEFGDLLNYTATVIRKKANSDKELKDIEVAGTPISDFTVVPKVFKKVALDRNIGSVNVEGIKKDNFKGTITYFVGTNEHKNGQIPVTPGKLTTVIIRVTAEDDTWQDYNITLAPTSFEKDLKEISLEDEKIILPNPTTDDKGNINYEQNVTYSTDKTNLKITVSEFAKIKSNDISESGVFLWTLKEGKNTIRFTIMSESEDESVVYTIVIERASARTDKYLEKLVIESDNNLLNATHDSKNPIKNTYDFYIPRSIEHITIIATVPNGNGSSIKGTSKLGTLKLNNYGKTADIFEIYVLDEKNQENKYIIRIYRQDSDATLKNIIIDGAEYTFDANKNLIITKPFSSDKQNVDVTINPNSEHSSIKTDTFAVSSNKGTWILDKTDLSFKITVISEDSKTTNIYTVQATKDKSSEENDISKLSITNGTTEYVNTQNQFTKGDTRFSARVGSNITTVLVKAYILISDKSTITTQSKNKTTDGLYTVYEFDVTLIANRKDNEFKIDVKSEMGITKTLTILINTYNDNSKIESIEVNGNNINLIKDTYEYDLGEYEYTKEALKIRVQMEDSKNASYKIGNKTTKSGEIFEYTLLEEGPHKIIIVGVSDEGNVNPQTYTLTYKMKKAKTDNNLEDLEVIVDGQTEIISSQDPFNKTKTLYSLSVNRSVNKVVVNAYIRRSDLSVIDRGTLDKSDSVLDKYTFEIILKAGDVVNTAMIITSQSGEKNTVTIAISAKNSDKITKISIPETPFVFKKGEKIQQISTNVFNYNDLNKGSIKILLEYTDLVYSKVTINGVSAGETNNFQLEVGNNKQIKILLIDDRGNKDEYILEYSRNPQSSENKLKELIISVDKNEIINENNLTSDISTNITYRVNRDSKEIKITANPVSTLSKITINPNSFNLKPGENKYTISVEAEDGSINDYIITIIAKNDNSKLDGIIIDGIDYTTLEKDTLGRYIISDTPFSFSKKNFSVKVTTDDEYAIVIGQTNKEFEVPLQLGKDKTFTVQVASEYGTNSTEIYTFVYSQNAASNKTILKTIDVSVDGSLITLDAEKKPFAYPYNNPTNLRVDRINANKIVTINNATAEFNGKIKSISNSNKPLNLGLNIIEVLIVAEDGTEGTYVINLYVADDDNEITGIKVQGKELEPGFSKSITDYEIKESFKYNISNLLVSVTTKSNSTVVTGSGRVAIDYEENTLVIKSRSEYRNLINDHTNDLEYRVEVYREEPFKDVNLQDLYVIDENGDRIDFTAPTKLYKEGVYVYSVQLSKDIEYTYVNVHAFIKDARQKLMDINGEIISEEAFIQFMVIPIREIYKFKVVAEDGAEREYTINFTQGTTISSDNSIQSVTLRDLISTPQYLKGDQEFKKDKSKYEITVPYSVTTLDLLVKATDSKANVFGNGTYNLITDETQIDFHVTAENGSEGQMYTIIVKRSAPSQNNLLEELIVVIGGKEVVIGGSKDNPTKLVFDPIENLYDLILDRTNKEAKITAKTADKSATLSGNFQGNLRLRPGTNEYTITVTAEDKTYVNNYYVSIEIINDFIEIDNLTVDVYETGHELIHDKTQTGITYDLGTVDSTVQVLNINASIPNDSYGTLTGNGRQVLVDGINRFVVKATSEDKSKTVEYTIIINKKKGNNGPSELSKDADLYALTIEGTKEVINLNYDEANQGIYKVTLSALDDKFFLRAEKHQKASVIGAEWHSIAEGETKTIKVQVTAEDGTKGKIYELEVTRPKASTDNTLLDLYVEANGKVYKLDVTKTYQEVNVDPTVTEVTFGGTHPTFSKISGLGLQPLTSTSNIFPITVISQSGEVKTYNVNVKKQDNNADLLDLIVLDEKTNNSLSLKPGFDKDITDYIIDLTNNPEILEINIQAKANGKASLKGIGIFTLKSGTGKVTDRYVVTVTAEDGLTTKDYTVTIERNIDPEDSITIEDLTLIGETTIYLGNDKHPDALNQFTMSKVAYEIKVPYALQTVILSLSNKDGATIYGAKSYSLTDKETTITFYLVSKSGNVTSDKYTVKLIKEDPSDDATLKSLTLDGILIENFDPEVFSYTKKIVLEDYSTVDIKALATNEFASVSGNTGVINISRGNNNINIRVTAENGDQNIYRITLIALSDKNEILDIKDSESKINFDKDTPIYRINVSYTTQNFSLKVTSSLYSTITGDGVKLLEEGENIYYVYATSEFGTQGKVYQIIVTREAISDDATLKSLVVKRNSNTGDVLEYKPVFDSNRTNYIINLAEGDSLTTLFIEAEANSEFAIVGGIGYKVLKAEVDGDYQNVFEIVVRAQSGKTLTYTVSVYRNVELSDLAEYESLELKGSDGIVYLGTDPSSKQTFNKPETMYLIEVPYSVKSMTLNAKALYGSLYGNETKSFGNSNELIFVTEIISQSGSVSSGKYTIKVIREIPKTENTLSDLTVDEVQVPNFDPKVNDYTLTIPVGTKKSVVIGAKTNTHAKITGTGLKDLKQGSNVYTINVEAQDGSINSYTITINYVNDDAFLETLIIKGTDKDAYKEETASTFEFAREYKKNELKRTIVVGPTTKIINIQGQAIDQIGAKISGFGIYEFPLNETSKTVYVYVVSADGFTQNRYEIEITRTGKANNIADLVNLSISGYQIQFDPKIKMYSVNVPNSLNELVLSANASETSNIDVRGYNQGKGIVTSSIKDIKTGQNVIVIEVTSEDGLTSEIYTITVTKDAPQDFLFLILLIASLLLWILTILYIAVKRQREKNKDKNEVIF